MTTINTSLSSAFAALDKDNKTTVTTETLANVLANDKSAAQTPNIDEAVDLNLSDEAKAMLEKASPIFTDFSGDRFVLNIRQRNTIESVIQKYKDAPFTQDTFDAIMNDLEGEGLSPEILSAKEKALSINPVGIFLAAMGGQDTTFNPLGDVSDDAQETKSSNFMLDVVARWHEITTAQGPAETDVDTDVDTGSGAVSETEES
ncbi:MAG: hypothetical protein U1E36_03730 [Rickettsiales bacterium]